MARKARRKLTNREKLVRREKRKLERLRDKKCELMGELARLDRLIESLYDTVHRLDPKPKADS